MSEDRGPCTECAASFDDCKPPDYCCDECLHLADDWEGYDVPRPAASPGTGDGRDGLREELAAAICDAEAGPAGYTWAELNSEGEPSRYSGIRDAYLAAADAVLSVPALSAALGAAEKLRALVAAVDAFGVFPEYGDGEASQQLAEALAEARALGGAS